MTTQKKGSAAFAVCGSFCTLETALEAARMLTLQGWDLLPIMSFAAGQDTRFGTGTFWKERLEALTGHPVLDTLLTAKTMECQQENITITSVADGRMLGFLTIRELCTIVGVALDNAIAAVRAEPDPEKRLIKVAVYSQGGFAMLRFEHYTETAPALDADGLPQQGSDLKSVRTTVGQHGGSMTLHWENNWCTLRILFPLPQKQ